MPSNQSIEKALSLIKNDTSKILGLKIGTHENVQPGEFIPKAGMYMLPTY